MYASYLVKHFHKLKLTRNYVYLSLLYGLSTLLIPFSVQLLVNNLALTGLWVSTFSFLLLISIGLLGSLLVKFTQLVMVEYLQRNILNNELEAWFDGTSHEKYQSPYFFEMFKILKSFSFICSEGIDFVLTTAFGLLAISFIHPAFLVIGVLYLASLGVLRFLGRGAVASSIEESNRKYELYDSLSTKNVNDYQNLALDYFKDRDTHFGFIRKQAVVIFGTFFVLQIILLAWGIHLIQIHQLSIGQLVSAEIISTNIFLHYVKLPKLLESFYDFETSCYKIDYAKSAVKV
jgi:hypothetical protein